MSEVAVVALQKDGYELLTTDIPEPKWLIPNLIVERTINVLVGTAGIGKTYMLLQLSKAILEEEDFFEFTPQGKHTILYYYFEGGESGCAERLKKYAWENLENARRFHPEYELSLATPEDWSNLKARVTQLGADVLVLDPLTKIVLPSRFDWNDNSDVGRFMQRLEEVVKETGVTVIVAHHKKKQERIAYTASNPAEYERTTHSGAQRLIDLSYTRMSISGKSKRLRELYLWGKDVPDTTLKLVHEKDTCHWRLRRPYGEDDDE